METEFTRIRKQVREDMTPRLRRLWAKAIAHEEAARHVSGDLYYAWNRVSRAIFEAEDMENSDG